MNTTSDFSEKSDLKVNLTLFAIVIVAVLLRLVGITNRPFWYDELQSLTHAIQPVREIFESVKRFDPHPPLYYFQLHFWLIPNTEHGWVRLNSVMWSVATIPAIFFAGRRLFDDATALLAAWLFCLSPLAVFYAQEVRMYAMQMCLFAWAFFFLDRFLLEPANRRLAITTLLLIAAAVYNQGAGFLIITSAACYVLLKLRLRVFAKSNRLVIWVGVGTVVLSCFWLIEARKTSLGHLSAPEIQQVVRDMSIFVLGPGNDVSSALVSLVVPLLAVLLFLDKKVRMITISFVILPAFLVFVLSYTISPIWHIRAIAGFLPFLSLTVAGAIGFVCSQLNVRQAVVLICVSLFALSVLPFSLSVNEGSSARKTRNQVATYLKQTMAPGTSVAFGNARDAWGIVWYMAEPGAIRTRNKRQVVETEDGLKIYYFSKPKYIKEGDDPTVWVYRKNHPDVTPEARRFNNIYVVKN